MESPRFEWEDALRLVKEGRGDLLTEEERSLVEEAISGEAAYSEPKKSTATTLYRFYDENGLLLYVGISLSMIMRFQSHAQSKPWWTHIKTARFEHFNSRLEALEAERKAIETEHPAHNVLHSLLGPMEPPSQQAPSGYVRRLAPSPRIKESQAYQAKRKLLGEE